MNDPIQGAVSPLPHNVSLRITGQKKYCVTYTNNHPEDDFETWKNVCYADQNAP
jgi:hypothetical protein